MSLTQKETDLNLEIYGKGALNVLMCPATEFWEDTISDVCDKIVNHL
jgi:hypothetical protein